MIKYKQFINLVTAGLLLLGVHTGWGQAKKTNNPVIQPGYFMFPIMPGEANSLSGGLGDLRANHFHAGLDIRTKQREGLDVYAAADGYISRIAVLTAGYGNVIFIKHPNGLTTVYGHLKVLNDTLARYLRQEQYKRQTFEIDLRPEPGQFPVRKGEVIALSGNTGGSGGPHLHFEIRDDKDNLLNPLLFGFNEITDEVNPYFEKVALRTLTPESRVNGEFQRLVLTPVRRADGSYGFNQPVTASGLIGLELLAFDKTSGSPFRSGLSCIEIKLDGREVFAYNMDSFPNEQTRYINVHMNYEAEQISGQRYHRGYVADGNALTLYKMDNWRGKLPLLDGKPHEITITLYDAHQNSAQLRFTVQPEPAPPAEATATQTITATTGTTPTGTVEPVPSVSIATDENVLKLTVRNLPAGEPPVAQLYMGRWPEELPVSYVKNNQAVYLIDLRKFMPDSVQIGSGIMRTFLQKRIVPGKEETYEKENVSLNFGPKTLFDTLFLAIRHMPGHVFEINQHTIPVNESLAVSYKPADTTGINPARTQLYNTSGNRKQLVGGTWKDGRIEFKTRQLGRFQLLTDTIPPKVQFVAKTPGTISAKITDDLSGINTFRALINGEWVLMLYDYKKALIWSDKLDPAKPFKGDVTIEVTDRAGNVTTASAVIP
ncbi:hypothetical protein GCM10023189_19830 [Nibrella saemangeumensis]|uniref:M23ase beta-sheet core domain-containing protein n=1 Tax=Nibrella saemangeumensis TaxID=1084526 RepID=A0ABP8MRW4_9BACT